MHAPRRPGDARTGSTPSWPTALNADDPARAKAFQSFLDSPRRVILEVEPTQRIGYDGAKMGEATAEWIAAQSGDAEPRPG